MTGQGDVDVHDAILDCDMPIDLSMSSFVFETAETAAAAAAPDAMEVEEGGAARAKGMEDDTTTAATEATEPAAAAAAAEGDMENMDGDIMNISGGSSIVSLVHRRSTPVSTIVVNASSKRLRANIGQIIKNTIENFKWYSSDDESPMVPDDQLSWEERNQRRKKQATRLGYKLADEILHTISSPSKMPSPIPPPPPPGTVL